MGYIIEISDTKVDKMSEYVEDMLWAGGELMHCIEKMKGEHGYGEREGYSHEGRSYRKDMMGSRYGMRSRYDNYGMREDYGMRGGYRDDEEWEEEEMGERRGRRRRDSRGRYM